MLLGLKTKLKNRVIIFGKIIKAYRRVHEKTQEEMAYLLNISATHLSRIEREIVFPSGDLINRIMIILSNDNLSLLNKYDDPSLAGMIILIHIERLSSEERKLVLTHTLQSIAFIQNVKKNSFE